MLGSVATSIVIFPATLHHLFSEVVTLPKYTFSCLFIFTLNSAATELFGLRFSPVSRISYTALLIEVACVIIMFFPIIFLLRNEKWFKLIIVKIKHSSDKIKKSLKGINLIIVSLFISSVGMIILTAVKVSVIAMGIYIDRYVFYTFPGFCVLYVMFAQYIAQLFLKKKKMVFTALAFISGITCVFSNMYSCEYLFPEPKGSLSVEDEIKGANCVFVTNEYWLLTCFSKDSMEAENIYAINIDSAEFLKNKIINIANPPDDKCIYYYVDDNLFYETDVKTGELVGEMPSKGLYNDTTKKMKREEFEALLLSKYSKAEYIGFGTVFKRKYSLYRVK